ncbi:calcium/sodium antiporter [Patescibacteria group bacterium]
MIFVVLVFGVLLFSMLLVKATDIVTDGLHDLAEKISVNAFGLTAFVLALATSLPELFVGITAAVHGNPEISMGNVIGSNIANLSLVLGGAALVAGSVKAYDEFLSGEVFHTFLAGSLPLLLLIDGSLTRLDGVLLLVVYLLYNLTVLQERREEMVKSKKKQISWYRRLWFKIADKDVERSVGKLVIGVALMIASADMLVRIAEQAAIRLNLPMALVGMVLVAIGTSLPELSFGIAALKKKETEMALGNILGSVVANSTLILGITALLSPFDLDGGLRSYLIATIAFVVVFGFFWVFVRSKKQLDRWEGLVLLLMYAVFVIFELVKIRSGLALV